MPTDRLAAGDVAPEFRLESTHGVQSLEDYQGQWLVLYFYPKDDTPGCTTEACDFRDNLEQLGVPVLGVSADDIASHQGFADKYQLPFPLLSDPGAAMAKAYGSYGVKNMYGKSFEGVLRSSFIINPQGHIAEAMYNVNAKGHVARLAKRLQELQRS